MKPRAFSLFPDTLSPAPLSLASLFLGLLILAPVTTDAQQRICGTMDYLNHQLESNPNLRYAMQMIERQTEENIKGAGNRLDNDIVIPVVVHVVYNTPEQNISDAQIYSQIQILNQDFRRQNPDRDKTPEEYAHLAADTRISFRLANRDPQGQPTSGITRSRTQQESFLVQTNSVKYSAMGGVDAWPTNQYLNIWVCNLAMGVLGYSQFPGGPAETDGVVIGYKFFGNTGPVRAPFNGGRTCTHEVGHWLNLRHIWGDGPCSVDDHVADTPPADRPTQGCPVSRFACDGPVMTTNFMDYTDDACMNLFTFGQADRMQALFQPGGPRASFRDSRGYEGPAQPSLVSGLEVELLSPSAVRLLWQGLPDADSYQVRFRRQGQTEWLRRAFSGTSVKTGGLQPCTDYEFQVEAVLAGAGQGFSPSRWFRTGGCPTGIGNQPGSGSPVPSSLEATPVAPTRVNLRWQPVQGATGYRVQLKEIGSRNVMSFQVEATQLPVDGMQVGKQYFWRVRADFSGQAGPFTPVESFLMQENMANLRTSLPAGGLQVLEGPATHALRSGELPVRLMMQAPAAFSAAILDAEGEVVKEFPSRVLRHQTWFKVPVSGLRPGWHRLLLRDPDGFELSLDFTLE